MIYTLWFVMVMMEVRKVRMVTGEMSGCVVWNETLVSLYYNNLYFSLFNMMLYTERYLLHISYVHCC